MKEKRENCYQKLEALKKEIAANQENMHRYMSYRQKEAEKLKKLLAVQIEKKAEFEEQLQQLDQFDEEETLSEAQVHAIDPLNQLRELFNKGEELIHAKPHFLNFIFGRHPKVVLAHVIHEAMYEAKQLQKKLPQHKKLQQFCHAFIKEADRPWNQALYRDKFLEFKREFQSLELEAAD